MISKFRLSSLFAAAAVVTVAAQAPADPPFEVASVKINTSGDLNKLELEILPGGHFKATNVPLKELILIAYGIQDFQLVDLPGWADSERFDIEARAGVELTPGIPPPQLRSLLAERFNLRVVREEREVPIYELVLAASQGPGAKLIAGSVDHCRPQVPAREERAQTLPADQNRCFFRMGRGTLSAGSMGIATLASRLQSVTRRVVVDRTALDGVFDYELAWTPDDVVADADSQRGSIFTALQEQLGLKLQASRGRADVLVVNQISHLVPN
jgi:uncharacterized protein (TIGR03435 family)